MYVSVLEMDVTRQVERVNNHVNGWPSPSFLARVLSNGLEATLVSTGIVFLSAYNTGCSFI